MSRKSKQRDYARRARQREHTAGQRPRGHEVISAEEVSGKIFDGDKNGANKGWTRYKEQQLALMPERLPRNPHKRCVEVFVEGYEDVAFWRGIFDNYETEHLTFEIGVPPREDLAKGKKVLMGMIEQSSKTRLLCVDSDFDYLFGERTEQSRTILHAPFMFHTYAYATENFLCYAPSLHNVCVKATKNDTRIFDFEKFIAEYSRTIYPLFLWYAYSAHLKNENVLTLLDFKSTAKLNYLEVENNGADTITWLKRQVDKRVQSLENKHPHMAVALEKFEEHLNCRGLTPDLTYMFMQGHTLMDNVVMVMLNAVCDQLKLMSNIRITTSTKTGTALKNELSNYNNSLRGVREVLLDNESYKDCPQYKMLQQDIESYLASL